MFDTSFSNLYFTYLSKCNQLEKLQVFEKDLVDELVNIDNLAQSRFKLLEQSGIEIPKDVERIKNGWANLENKFDRILFKFNKKLIIENENGNIAVSIRDLTSVQFQATPTGRSILDRATVYLQLILPLIIKKLLNNISSHIYAPHHNKMTAKKLYRKIEKLELKKNKIQKEFEQIIDQKIKDNLQIKLTNIEYEISKIEEKLNLFESKEIKAQESRDNLERIGGERIELITSDHVKLDATFLDAQKFKESLKNNGAKFAKIIRQTNDSEKENIEALVFNKDDFANNKNHILLTLEKLRAYHQPNSSVEEALESSGWCQVFHENQIFLINNEHISDLVKDKGNPENLFEFDAKNSRLKIKDDKASQILIEVEEIDLSKKSSGGTVIITSGARGVYEMHKAEAMAFLLKGMNVMLFNFRGFGLSEGEPSADGFNKDMKVAFEFCKKRTQQEDNRILFKTICMSSGPAAYIASLYPNTNIFLDQTYSSFKKLLEENAIDIIKEHIKKEEANLSPTQKRTLFLRIKKYLIEHWDYVIRFLARMTAPNFEVANNLIKNHGQKAIFFVCDDEMVSISHIEEILKNLSKADKLNQTIVYSAPVGGHGASWLNVKSSPAMFDKKIFSEMEKIKKEAEAKVINLFERATEILSNTLRQKEILEKNANDIEKGKVIEGITKTPQELRDNAEMIMLDAVKNSDLIMSEVADIEKQSKEKIKQLMTFHEPEMFIPSYTGKTQVNHFLSKANLSDDILK